MKIGIIGNNGGLTTKQIYSTKNLLNKLAPKEIHHLNETSADYTFHHSFYKQYNIITYKANRPIVENWANQCKEPRDTEDFCKNIDILLLFVTNGKTLGKSQIANINKKYMYITADGEILTN